MSSIQDGLSGVTFDGDLPDDSFVADAIVILRLVGKGDGQETFLIRNNEGISPIVQVGLMHCAMDVIDGLEEVQQ